MAISFFPLTDTEDVSGYATATFSTAGSTAITAPVGCRVYTYRAVLQAGAGAYTRTFTPGTTNRVAGDTLVLVVESPASANPTWQLVGAATYSVPATGVADTQNFLFTFNGTAWVSNIGLPTV